MEECKCSEIIKVVAGLCLVYPMLWGTAKGVEFAKLSTENYDHFAPQGKEADAILGDYVLRNEHLSVVIGRAVPNRNANMTVRNVGGAIIDLTQTAHQNDQLSAYYPAFGDFTRGAQVQVGVEWQNVESAPDVLTWPKIILALEREAEKDKPAYRVEYELADGEKGILIRTTFANTHKESLKLRVTDAVRADNTFELDIPAAGGRALIFDKWWDQAYGLTGLRWGKNASELAANAIALNLQKGEPGRTMILRFLPQGKEEIEMESGAKFVLERRIYPAANEFALLPLMEKDSMDKASNAGGVPRATIATARVPLTVLVHDANGPVDGVMVELTDPQRTLWHGSGKTEQGKITTDVLPGNYLLKATHFARPAVEQAIQVNGTDPISVDLEMVTPGIVDARIVNGEGLPTPCKVQFRGANGTMDPFFFHQSGAPAVHNVYYSHNGQFQTELMAGEYDVIVSYGPEHDAVFNKLQVQSGEKATLIARLTKSVNTDGWVSSDFHSHSSPSGDNTASQRGRVLNLLCEQIDFAPCTEHNRIDSYTPHLRALGVESLMATCTGMELTGQPLPINHQNAFPLKMVARVQDGGAPQTDINPEVQIERLAMWDDGAEKLVQINHPNLVQIYGDRDENGAADAGFRKMLGYMDVVEVHPPHWILTPGGEAPQGADAPNTIVNWMQLINLGYRKTGVVNTDAHYNFHGSGWLRNYIQSSSDDPAQIDVMEMVRSSEHGRLVMTSGPFLRVVAKSGVATAGPGEDLRAEQSKVALHIEVQCPNWFDVDRVLVLVNGRRLENWDYRRREHAPMFTSNVMRFQNDITISLESDAHLIVVAAGENSVLGPVMGPEHEKDMPIAVANPIYVDVDGNGFQPNGDLLGAKLPGAPERAGATP